MLLTLPGPTREAIADWIRVRPACAEVPLFTSLDRGKRGSGRLDGKTVYRVVVTIGKAVGVTTWPHAIRHLSITTALDVTKGDFRKVQRHNRHADPRTILRYDDNRQDIAGQVARLVAEES